MITANVQGRFLPSRVFDRWKWTVRFGLMVVPFLLLLSGGLVLFLTPSKFRSTTLFSLDNGPSVKEIVELVESREVLERVAERLDLTNKLRVDRDTAVKIIEGCSAAKSVPDTSLVELKVTLTNKTDARDVATEIPNCLRDYLVEGLRAVNQQKVGELDSLLVEARDGAVEKAKVVANFEKVHGSEPVDQAVVSILERARRSSILADAEVERLQSVRSHYLTSAIDEQPRLNVHSAPVISDLPSSPEAGSELGRLTVFSLICGLITALGLPYLMELAFPLGERRGGVPGPDDSL